MKRAQKTDTSSTNSKSSGIPESSSGDESSSSFSDENRKRKKKRKSNKSLPDFLGVFHIQREEEKHEYDLPYSLRDYVVDDYTKKFIPDKELKGTNVQSKTENILQLYMKMLE